MSRFGSEVILRELAVDFDLLDEQFNAADLGTKNGRFGDVGSKLCFIEPWMWWEGFGHAISLSDDGLGIFAGAEEERELNGGCLEAAQGLHGGDFTADDEALVVDLHDGSAGTSFHLLSDGAVAVFGDTQQFFGKCEALSAGDPGVVAERGRSSEVEVLSQDDRICEFLVDLRLPEAGSAAVDGAITQQRDAKTEYAFAIDTSAVLVVVRQEAAAQTVAAIHAASPERQRLLQHGVTSSAIVVTGEVHRAAGIQIEVKSAHRLADASIGDVLLDQRGEIGRIL
jgi:hypothetical protein